MKKTVIASTSILALCLALPVAAEGTDSSRSPASGMQEPGATNGGSPSKAGAVSRQDRKFVEDAAMGSMAEVQFGQIATQRAQHQAVRDFGNTMVSDHTPANQRLMTIAATLGIMPPDKLDFMHRHTAKKLGKAEGREFDEDYIKGQVKDHEKMIELMEDQIKEGQNADLKQLATDLLPKLREHLQMAKSIETQLQQEAKK